MCFMHSFFIIQPEQSEVPHNSWHDAEQDAQKMPTALSFLMIIINNQIITYNYYEKNCTIILCMLIDS